MTTTEFSNEFDIGISSYLRKLGFSNDQIQAVTFDEYEKSVFLTKGEGDLVIELVSGKNINADSFEKTEEIRRYLDSLVKTATITTKLSTAGLSASSSLYTLPTDLWYIVYEHVVNSTTSEVITVVPTTHTEYMRIMSNPFRGPTDGRALRLDVGSKIVEIIALFTISSYVVRYLKAPSPIILIPLPTNLSINGISVVTECELNSIAHREILDRAIRLALQSRAIIQAQGK